MNITIQQLDEHNFRDLNRCDSTFTVDSKLVLQIENDVIHYTLVSVPPYQKRYLAEELDYTTYLNHPDKAIFFAYADGQLTGQIIVRKNWNHYGYVEDIAVDASFRREGVGRALLQHAVAWARDRQLAGVMLETQNNNGAACRLYESCGFQLAGFDRCLYKGLHPDTDEVALYWYLLFADVSS
jgi:ribosomal protein S18 acetylase RimI-like enzyme